MYEVKVIEHIAKAERNTFYPITKYVGLVLEDGRTVASTGYCANRFSAQLRAEALRSAL